MRAAENEIKMKDLRDQSVKRVVQPKIIIKKSLVLFTHVVPNSTAVIHLFIYGTYTYIYYFDKINRRTPITERYKTNF